MSKIQTITIKKYDYKLLQLSKINYFLLIDKDNNSLHAPFMCKDYFQEICKVELSTISMVNPIYGLPWSYQGLFKDIDTLRVCCFESVYYKNYGFKVPIKDKADIIISIFNSLEKNLKFKTLTTVDYCNIAESTEYTHNPEGFILNIPLEWVKYPYLVSFYFTLCRAIIELDVKEFPDYNFNTMLDKLFINSKSVSCDSIFLIKPSQNLFSLLYYGEIPVPEKTYEDFEYNSESIHNDSGISTTFKKQLKFKQQIDDRIIKIEKEKTNSISPKNKNKAPITRRVKKKSEPITV